MKNLLLILTVLSTTILMAKSMDRGDLVQIAQKEVGQVTPQQLKIFLDKEEDIIVLDVRESEQRSEGSIPSNEFNEENFISITRGNLEWKINRNIHDKDVLIVTYCRKGGRGALAAKVLRTMGYKNATTLQGGLKGWAKAGYPIKTGLGVVKLSNDKSH